MKVLYIGSAGTLSQVPLHRIAVSDHDLVAVGVDAVLPREGELIAVHNETVEAFARQQGLPVLDLAQPAGACAERIVKLGPDIILTSCYPRRIADTVLSAAPLGAYNLHPSMLPAYRGPMPVFWQLRDDLDPLGVSVHRMSRRLDAGNIAAQRDVAIDDLLDYESILASLAAAGSNLFLRVLEALEQGRLHDVPQQEEASSYQPFPDEDAFVLPATWNAQRMFRFIRRTHALGHSYHYEMNGIALTVKNAVSWSHAFTDHPDIRKDRAVIPCRDGSIEVELDGIHEEKP